MFEQSIDQSADTLYQQAKCPVCGNQSFEWGQIYTAQMIYFFPNPSASLRSPYGERRLFKVRRCLQCNNLAFFAESQERTRAVIRQVNRMACVLALVVFGFIGIVVVVAILAFLMARP